MTLRLIPVLNQWVLRISEATEMRRPDRKNVVVGAIRALEASQEGKQSAIQTLVESGVTPRNA